MKFGRLSSGFKSRLAKAEPGRPVVSLAVVAAMWRLMRRCANFWARGNAAPKSVCTRLAQGFQLLEGSSVATGMGEEAARLAECTTLARNTEDSPATWEAPYLRESETVKGEPVPNLRGSTRLQMRERSRQEQASVLSVGRSEGNQSDGRRKQGRRRTE